jgi:peptidoglycan/LPS O-acetylase OafA/YrhL
MLGEFLRHSGLSTLYLPAALLTLSIAGRLLSGGDISVAGATWWNTLPLFASGMLAYECWSSPIWRGALGTTLSSVAGIVGLVIAMTLSKDAYGWSMPLFAFFFLTVACGNSVGGLLRTRAAVALGELSFPVYLLHGIVLWLGVNALSSVAAGEAEPVLFALPAISVLTVGIAFLANFCVERPTLVVGERIAAKLARYRTAAW